MMYRQIPYFRVMLLVCLTLVALVATGSTRLFSRAYAQESEAAGPLFTISALSSNFQTDPNAFGLLLEPTRHVTADSQYFYRTPEGLAKLKQLGLKTIFYVADRNNWRALYDDISGWPQPYPDGIYPAEAVAIAKAVGAEIVPMLNVTVQCEHIEGMPYTSENMTCKHAKPKDSVALVKLLKKEAAKNKVTFKRVIMALEPYAGCAYWSSPRGVNCTVGNPQGQHRIGLPAEEYAKRINTWAKAIHKYDASIEIGAHLQTNTYYCQTGCNRSWSQVVLQDAGSNIDFVLVHQYFRLSDLTVPLPTLAQTYSYYANQRDQNVTKVGKTGMPSQMRKEIEKWAPADKKNLPMWYPEFNSSYPDALRGAEAANIRSALYTGLSNGELYLDILSPVRAGKRVKAGASRAALHHLFADATFIAAHQPFQAETQSVIFTPSWHILSSLKVFAGKTWLNAKPSAIPTNATGRPSVIGYAARKNKSVVLAFFNHDETTTHTIDVKLKDLTAKSAKVTRVGDTATSLADQNNLANPSLIAPQTTPLPSSQIKGWGLDNIALAPHSLTLIQVTLK